MKTLKLLLVLGIFSYCFTDAIDCEHEFEELLKQKCNEIPSCSYNPYDPDHRCVQTHGCNTGTSLNCSKINPSNYPARKCEYDYDTNSCEETSRLCGDYKNGNNIIGDDCTLLTAPIPAKQRCILTYDSSDLSQFECKAHYKKCQEVDLSSSNPQSECDTNNPENYREKCSYISGSGTTAPSCNTVDRYCDEGDKTFVNFFGKDKCSSLPLSGGVTEQAKKKCVYNGNRCEERYKKCQYVTGTCDNYIPLKDDETDYNYTAKCFYNTDSSTCEPRKRKCSEFSAIPSELRNEDTCDQLETSQTYYRCAYNEKDNKCEEQYDGCDKYIINKVETDRDGCEDIVLRDKTKKCVYIQKEDKCITKDIYSKCGDYLGNDKKICESILSSDNNQYCILDKDTNCTEKPINCTEAHGDKEKCLKIAKSTENNKRCAYKSVCYDEYLRCEDYLGTDSTECKGINLYDGKKCEWETISGTIGTQRCRSSFKTCDDATTKEECKLIFKTGVTDPERRVCDWNGNTNKCFENYKYCSDYRGADPDFCAGIKPYDESGDNLDIGFKCSLDENDVGCQKIPVECKDAKNSRSLCESYSQYIKDSDKKFCVYDSTRPSGQQCFSQYRKCEYIQHPDEINTDCTNNIIEGYIKNACEKDSNSKCVTRSSHNNNICIRLASTYTSNKDYFAKRINPSCSFSSPTSKFEYKENTCSQVTFYTNRTENKDICENIIPSLPYKKCTLKEDGSSCEEVYREFNFSTAGISYSRAPDNTSQENSSHFIKKGIHLMMALICLLI